MENHKRILVIRLSSIGDVILTTPVLKAFKEKYPESIIDFLVIDKFKDAISLSPYVDNLLLFNKEKNDGLMEMIKTQHFDASKYQTTTIINVEDAIFGTGPFVKSSSEKGKKNNPHSQVILDQTGQVKKGWGLQPKESLIVVLDKSGKVKFAHEGKLSEQQMNQVIELIKNLVQ